MTERPILFSAQMVRAILAGTKTQTRRIVKPQPEAMHTVYPPPSDGEWYWKHATLDAGYCHTNGDAMVRLMLPRCPYGKPGDRLWVREAHAIVPRTAYRCSKGVQQTLRPEDDHDAAIYREGWTLSRGGLRWRPSIHMPRWASRITLDITTVRVERLQDISVADAVAEGLSRRTAKLLRVEKFGLPEWADELWRMSPLDAYMHLWESINGPGSWDANPWVWVVEFRRAP